MRSPYLDAPPAIRAAVAFTAASVLAVGFALMHGDPISQTNFGSAIGVAALAWWTTKKQP